MINPQTGLRTCHFDPDNRIEVFEFWSSDLLKIFQQAGIQRRSPPPYEKNCQLSDKIIQGMGPHISSPRQSIHYAGNYNQPAKILLEAITDADVDALHWFANETYLGKSEPHQMMWWHAKPGHYTVRVIDNYGRADAVDTTIVEIDSPPLQRGEKSYTQDLIICSR